MKTLVLIQEWCAEQGYKCTPGWAGGSARNQNPPIYLTIGTRHCGGLGIRYGWVSGYGYLATEGYHGRGIERDPLNLHYCVEDRDQGYDFHDFEKSITDPNFFQELKGLLDENRIIASEQPKKA